MSTILGYIASLICESHIYDFWLSWWGAIERTRCIIAAAVKQITAYVVRNTLQDTIVVHRTRYSIGSSTRLRGCRCVWASNEHNILHSPAQEGKKRSTIDKTIHITTRAAHGPSGALTQAEDTIAEVLVFAILLSHERVPSCLVLHWSNRVYIPTFSLWDTPRLSGTHKHVTQTQIQRLDGNPVRKYAEQFLHNDVTRMLGVEAGHYIWVWTLGLGLGHGSRYLYTR